MHFTMLRMLTTDVIRHTENVDGPCNKNIQKPVKRQVNAYFSLFKYLQIIKALNWKLDKRYYDYHMGFLCVYYISPTL